MQNLQSEQRQGYSTSIAVLTKKDKGLQGTKMIRWDIWSAFLTYQDNYNLTIANHTYYWTAVLVSGVR
jgi:hypothetical protein